MINPIKHVKSILSFMALAKNSGYALREKVEIFRILFSTHFKSLWHPNNNEVTQKIFGFKVTTYNYRILQFLFKEVFLSHEYFFRHENDHPKIIDCGANIGISILYFKKLFPNSSIIAFEPNPHAYHLLVKNIEQNKLKGIETFNTALSSDNQQADFFLNQNKASLTGSMLQERGGEHKFLINTKKLSSFLDKQKVDLIKMDIEGAEMQVVDDLSATGTINNSSRYIIEYHHRINGDKSKLSKFIEHFENNGFDYNLKATFKNAGGFQDILLNIYKNESNDT